jgi:hypothetical protein
MSEIRLYFKSSAIRDEAEFLCLTDMWRAAGSDDSRRPAVWLRQDAAVQFTQFIADSQGVTPDHILRREHGNPRAGEGGATWAHWQLGMAYAQYLSPEFHAWCNDVVRKVMQGELAASGALASIVASIHALTEAVAALAARMTKLENNQAALWSHISEGGYIAAGRFDQLWRERKTLAEVEVALGKWKDRLSALEGITRDMRDATNWGGVGKPWKRMPAALEPAARAVLERRMKDVTRGSKPKGQLSLLKNA